MTEVGAAIVKDINPGEPSTGISELTDVRGTLYFVAHQHKRGNQLWTSDGTDGGTVMIEDLYPGQKGSKPYSITEFGGTVFFSARTLATGRELWTFSPG